MASRRLITNPEGNDFPPSVWGASNFRSERKRGQKSQGERSVLIFLGENNRKITLGHIGCHRMWETMRFVYADGKYSATLNLSDMLSSEACSPGHVCSGIERLIDKSK